MQIHVTAKNFSDALRLPLPQESVVHENAVKLPANRFGQKRGRHRGVHPAAETKNDTVRPDLFADLLDRAAHKGTHRPRALTAADLVQEVFEDFPAARRMGHLRVELQPVNVFPPDNGVGTVLRGGHGFKSFGQTGDPIPMAVPNLQMFGQAGEQGAGPAAMQRATTIFAPGSPRHLPPELFDQKLHPIADAENGDAEVENAAIHLWCLGGINAGRTAAEDDPAWAEGENFPDRDGVGDDLGIDVGLADPAGNHLGVLGAEIKDQDPFLDSVGTC